MNKDDKIGEKHPLRKKKEQQMEPKPVKRKALAQALFLSETGLREAGTEIVNRFVQILESGSF